MLLLLFIILIMNCRKFACRQAVQTMNGSNDIVEQGGLAAWGAKTNREHGECPEFCGRIAALICKFHNNLAHLIYIFKFSVYPTQW